jgi:O-antigen/teichoic acid export membrane protein
MTLCGESLVIKKEELAIGSAFLVVGQTVQAIFGFSVNLVLVRYLSPEEFGRFAITLAGAALVYSVLSLRTETMVIRVPEDQLSDAVKDRYFGAALIETVLATCVICIWTLTSSSSGNWEIGLILALGLRHWMFQNKAFFERTMPYRKLALIETIVVTTSHLFALGLVISGVGWVVLFIREIFLSVASLAGLWAIGGLSLRKFKMPSVDDWRLLFTEARGIWLDAALENGFARMTILFIGLFEGDRAAGFFFQALRLANLPQQVLSPLVSRVAGTWFGQMEDRVTRRKGRDKLLLVISLPLALGAGLTVAFSDPVIPWMFGDEWVRTANLMVGLSGFIFFLSLFEVLKAYCWFSRHMRWMLIGRVLQYIGIAIPVYSALTNSIGGDMAMAIGQSVAYGLAFIAVLILLKKAENY